MKNRAFSFIMYSFDSIVMVFAFSLVLSLSVQAAPITWTVHDISGLRTDVSTNGVLVEARTGATGADHTINGVTFLRVSSSTNLFDSLFANDNISGRRGSISFEDHYGSFLQLGQRSGRLGFNTPPQIEPTEVWADIVLTNLNVGSTYMLQIWISDVNTTDGDAGNSGLLLADATGSADPTFSTNNIIFKEYADGLTPGAPGLAGQYGIGEFVAGASTERISVRGYNNLLTTPSAAISDHYAAGWQLRLTYTPPAGTVIVIQ